MIQLRSMNWKQSGGPSISSKSLVRRVTHVKGKREICLDSNWIYFMQQAESGLFKIGFSNDPQTRRTALQVGNPHKLVLQFTHQTQRPDVLGDQIQGSGYEFNSYELTYFFFIIIYGESVVDRVSRHGSRPMNSGRWATPNWETGE